MNKKAGVLSEKDADTLVTLTVEHGATLKDIHGISEETMENIYAHAYQFYNDGRLDEAEKFFRFLCLYDLKNPDYFIGLGAVYQLKKQYEKACEFYSLSFLMSKSNYSPIFYTAQCQLLSGKVDEAIKCFEFIIEGSDDEKLLAKSRIYLEALRKNKNVRSEVTPVNQGA